jgi:hypothetical protein
MGGNVKAEMLVGFQYVTKLKLGWGFVKVEKNYNGIF